MTTGKQISEFTISGGVVASLLDLTSHYFGGYYHVRIQVLAHIPVLNSAFENPSDYEDAVNRLGDTIRFSRILEKMAVPENMIETVLSDLANSFTANVLPYLLREGFCGNYVRSEYCKALKSSQPRFR